MVETRINVNNEEYVIRPNGHGGVAVRTPAFAATLSQLKILRLRSQKMPLAEIGRELRVAEQTVKNQLTYLREKNMNLTGMWHTTKELIEQATNAGFFVLVH